jgi:hypothetical protein
MPQYRHANQNRPPPCTGVIRAAHIITLLAAAGALACIAGSGSPPDRSSRNRPWPRWQRGLANLPAALSHAPGDDVLPVTCPRGQHLTFWSSDVHITPPVDLANVFDRLSGAVPPGDTPALTLVDRSLSGHCKISNTCAKDLRVLTNAMLVAGMSCKDKEQFWREYASDPSMAGIDAFFVSYAGPSSLAFLPFDRPILLLLTIRYEVSVTDPLKWAEYTRALVELGRHHPRFVIAANNVFDRKYVQYFTGLNDAQVLYLPSYCEVKEKYAPVKGAPLLIAPRRVGSKALVQSIKAEFAINGGGLNATWMADAYPRYEMGQLATHPAVIFLPYTISVMTFFELYRMNIPLLVPTRRLLAKWHVKHGLLAELTWPLASGAGSPLPPAPQFAGWPDPNNDTDLAGLDFWLQHADLYTFEHVITFDSISDLVAKARDLTDRNAWPTVSAAMADFNGRQLAGILHTWRSTVLPRMFGGGGTACHPRPRPNMLNETYARAAAAAYPGVETGC